MTDCEESIATCHFCGVSMDVSALAPFSRAQCPDCGAQTRVKLAFGPYTLVRRHAVGGMSMVFAAQDPTLNREVAVKILSEDYSANERRIAAFEEEARITASFSHPNVVRVLRTGRAFGRFYIAMEFVPGGHFEHHIRERGKIPEAEMLPLAIEVAQGLKAAHAAGLIHRDVKPGNILLNAEGHAKLVDFGLALVTHGGTAQATEMWATPYYVPPETVDGSPEDFRSDVYAFGATLYHALAGQPSCGEQSMATDVLREAKKRVVPLSARDSSISPEICRIVERAMAYRPKDRFSSYDELIASLEGTLSRLKYGRAQPSETTATRRAGNQKYMKIAVLAGGLALIAMGVMIVGWVWHPKPQPVGETPPPVVVPIVPPVVVVDTSVEIAANYRDARAAVEAKNYARAAEGFVMLHHNPAVQEPTRTWAGVEAVLATFLDGRAPDVPTLARETLEHARSLPPAPSPLSAELMATLEQLDRHPPLAPPSATGAGASPVIAAMLAGLKNWEQGMPERAALCFSSALAITLPKDDAWVAIYQELARDYLADFQILAGPLFNTQPADKPACDALIRELEALLPRLKTRGRIRFDVRARQLDLTRHAKLAAPAASAAPGN